jgi:16S rRNA (guanine966-N2)-methyltransferase
VPKPRILAGRAKGQTLQTPKEGTRPSPAKLRAAVFDILQGREPGGFLDLFAGSGGVGLEAASRDWNATLVELARPACRVIERNARDLKLRVTVTAGDAIHFAETHPETFDVVFAAPPYPLDLADVFSKLIKAHPQRTGGVMLLQHPTDFDVDSECHDALAGAPTSNALTRIG